MHKLLYVSAGALGILMSTSVAATSIVAATTQVAERQVWGKVTKVVPINRPVEIELPASCAAPRPSVPQHQAAALATLLAWDLNPDCREVAGSETIGYRVSYSWDGRSYTVKLAQDPGTRIPLTLRLR